MKAITSTESIKDETYFSQFLRAFFPPLARARHPTLGSRKQRGQKKEGRKLVTRQFEGRTRTIFSLVLVVALARKIVKM